MAYRKGITDKTKALAYVLRDKGYIYTEIAKKCRISRTSAIQYSRAPSNQTKNNMKTNCRQGRPRKLSEMDIRHLVCSLHQLRAITPNFTIKKLVEFAGMNFKDIHYRTYARALHEENYGYRQTRKKGVISQKNRNKKKRLRFAKKSKNILKKEPNFF